MTDPLNAWDRALEEVREDLRGMREDIKEVAQALNGLVRIEGDQRRIEEKVNRIGADLQESKREYGRRIHALEIAQAENTKSVGLFDWLVRYGASAVIGSAITLVFLTKVTGAA